MIGPPLWKLSIRKFELNIPGLCAGEGAAAGLAAAGEVAAGDVAAAGAPGAPGTPGAPGAGDSRVAEIGRAHV